MAGRKKEKEKKKKKDAAVSAKRQMKEKKKKQGKGKGGLLSRISKPAYMEKIERTQDLVHMLFDGYSERYGIFWKDGRYSKMYEMEDVSFAKAQDEDKYIIMKKWMDLFHSLSKNVHVQILVTSVPTKQEEYKMASSIPENAAILRSSSLWICWVPQINRTEDRPKPH